MKYTGLTLSWAPTLTLIHPRFSRTIHGKSSSPPTRCASCYGCGPEQHPSRHRSEGGHGAAPCLAAYPTPVTRAALKLAMLAAMRPGLVAAARWTDMDLDNAEWSVPAPMMKMRHAHIVPLPKQALTVLRKMEGYTGGKDYVFPPLARQKSEHIHRDAMSNALRLMGFQGRHATHGFRGMLRTVARERLGVNADVLEAQLAHAKKGDEQKTYDRTTFNDERRRVMQKWAGYLDDIRAGGKIVQLRQIYKS